MENIAIVQQQDIPAKQAALSSIEQAEAGYQLGLFQQQTGSSVLESNSGKRYHIVNNYKVAGNAE